jgi:TetR/AcrR family transcriptional regulator, cholesterol catabolism regulator
MDQTPIPGLTASQHGRRAAIVAATVDLLATREHGQIHMREIAESAGVALATLYRYFGSKELLFAHAVVAWGGAFVASARRRAGSTTSDRERMQQAFARTIKAYERWPNFYRLIAALEITEDEAARLVFQAYSASYQEALRAVLAETAPEDAAMIAQILLSSLGAALRKWSVGEWQTGAVYDHMERAVDLMFRAPRKSGEG